MNKMTAEYQSHTLKHGNRAHKLTHEELSKGGKKPSIQRSIARKVAKYAKTNLSCETCKKKCLLFQANAQDCAKGKIILRMRDIARSEDPLPIFDEFVGLLMDMRSDVEKDYGHLDPNGTIKFQKQKIILDKFSQLYDIKFGKKYDMNVKHKMPSPADVMALINSNTTPLPDMLVYEDIEEETNEN